MMKYVSKEVDHLQFSSYGRPFINSTFLISFVRSCLKDQLKGALIVADSMTAPMKRIAVAWLPLKLLERPEALVVVS